MAIAAGSGPEHSPQASAAVTRATEAWNTEAADTQTPETFTLAAGRQPGTQGRRTLTNRRPPEQSFEHLAPAYHLDREYRSMQGPESSETLQVRAGTPREVLWLTGFRASMVFADTLEPAAQDYMCHSNLDFFPDSSRVRLGGTQDGRLFTLSQGQLDISFPEGFGIPIMSDEWLALRTQALNLNYSGTPVDVRHNIGIDYLRDRDVGDSITPLFQVGVYGMKLLEGKDGHVGLDEANPAEHGPGCMVGSAAADGAYSDDFGRKFTGHWVVPPGREMNTTRVTSVLNLPYDTTVHYIAVHLHPYAESISLRDRSTGRTVFRSRATMMEDRIGIDRVEYFSSREGIALYQDHEYELTSVYNNTTGEDQDSMAVMYLYLHDKRFNRARLRAMSQPMLPPSKGGSQQQGAVHYNSGSVPAGDTGKKTAAGPSLSESPATRAGNRPTAAGNATDVPR